jgi:hypothetical protein
MVRTGYIIVKKGGVAGLYVGRGLHSFTVELNLSNSRTHS